MIFKNGGGRVCGGFRICGSVVELILFDGSDWSGFVRTRAVCGDGGERRSINVGGWW